MTNTKTEQARAIIKALTLEQCLNLWEMTATHNDTSMPILRGWLMDEFEERNFDGFNAWLESEDCNDFKLRQYMRRV